MRRRHDPYARLRRRHYRETGKPMKSSRHIGDLLTPEEMDAARTVYGPRTARFNAAVAAIQIREARDRADRAAEERATIEREQAEREQAESADSLEKLRASTDAAHHRIDRLTEEQRAQRRRDANEGVNITRDGGK